VAGDDGLRAHALEALTGLAFAAGALDKAAAYASDLLAWASDPESAWPGIDHAPNVAHTILGRVALRRGEVARAADHLLRSADIVAHPPFTFAGPPMRLAFEMLERGERAAVLGFFLACARFWKTDLLERWADEVRAGRIPAFGHHLDH
jgi:hypothetical protein